MKKTNPIELIEGLHCIYERLRREMKTGWDRDLPLEELLFDRWERAQFLGFGRGASIYHNSYVYGKVTVGEHTWIGPFTVLDGTGGLNIGSYCSIAAGVQIYSHDSVGWAVSGGRSRLDRSPTRIGSRCYVGPYTVVAKGVSIGNGCIIGAHSLVLESIPSGSIAHGVPCRVTGRVASTKYWPGTDHRVTSRRVNPKTT